MKKRTRIAAFALALCICAVSAAGCGDKKTADNSSYDKAEKTTTAAVTEEAATEAATTEEITTEAATEAATAAAPTELSDKYVDFTNMSFKYNGQLMTLGVSTLQDFIDAGLEPKDNYDKMWNEDFHGDPHEAGCAIDYKINGKEISGIHLYFCNLEENGTPMKDCVLCYVYYGEFKTDKEKGAYSNNFEFAFPYNLSSEELAANSGEPTFKKSENGFYYTETSSVFPKHDRSYGFSFDNRNDWTIIGVEMTWTP